MPESPGRVVHGDLHFQCSGPLGVVDRTRAVLVLRHTSMFLPSAGAARRHEADGNWSTVLSYDDKWQSVLVMEDGPKGFAAFFCSRAYGSQRELVNVCLQCHV